MYDTIIIGGGVTGLAAAMYGGRLNLETLMLGASTSNEAPIGGVITLTEIVENYPGFIRLTGPELAEKLEAHAKEYSEVVTLKSERALTIQREVDGGYFTVTTDEEQTYQSKTLIIATGTKWKKLPMKGGAEFENRGVHYCALCDGPLFKNKIVAVVGGSDSAAKEAIFLAEHASKVYIIYRGDQIHPEAPNARRIEKLAGRIEIINNTNITEIKGEKVVSTVVLDKPYNGSSELALQAVFGAIGTLPLSDLAKTLGVETNPKGEIVLNHKDSSTNVPGVFAAGDVCDKGFKQAITGVAEGCTAAHSAFEYIAHLE